MNAHNEIDTGSTHWYISYMKYVADYGSDTTALVLGQAEYFLILNGDHRQGFKDCIKDRGNLTRLGACLQYVRDHKNDLNYMSNTII